MIHGVMVAPIPLTDIVPVQIWMGLPLINWDGNLTGKVLGCDPSRCQFESDLSLHNLKEK